MTNLPEVDFLDATFDLRTNTYWPYRKPNNISSYKDMSPKHPSEILKRLPISISELLSRISSHKQIFDSVKPEYEEALKKSGYQTSLEYIEANVCNIENKTNKMQRKRKIIWFSPPFNKNATTNVSRRFLNLPEKNFPKEHKLHKIFNKNTLKVSYSYSLNMTQIINSHNGKVKQPKKEESLSCNCRQKNDCPMDGKCHTMNKVYKCIASVPTKLDKSYIGLSEDEWKKCYYNHRKSFRNQRYQSVIKIVINVNNAIQSCVGNKTCYRPNTIPEIGNH